MKFKVLAVAALAAAACAPAASPCSRIVFRGDSTDVIMVGRTLDWRTPIPTNIYVYPAGIAKESMNTGVRMQWTSKYGSVLAVSYDEGVTEGMNEKGLVCNGLFCKGSVYRSAPAGSGAPVMSLAMIVSYFLDNFSTVDEAEAFLKASNFGIEGATFDEGTVSLLHWAVTDTTGVTLVIEFQGGKLYTYKSIDYQVMTNDPPFPDMLAINKYWKGVGGMNMLPGTVRSADRFVRADYFVHHVPTAGVGSDEALAELSSIIDNVSVPIGYEIPGQPFLSSTQWRSISDINRLRYYFKFSDSGGLFYVDMSRLMLTPGSPVLKLDTADHSDFYGCINHLLKESEPFTPKY